MRIVVYTWQTGEELRGVGFIYCDPDDNFNVWLERLFAYYNRGSGEEVEFEGPSMSVGDTVTLNDKVTFRCDSIGWETVS